MTTPASTQTSGVALHTQRALRTLRPPPPHTVKHRVCPHLRSSRPDLHTSTLPLYTHPAVPTAPNHPAATRMRLHLSRRFRRSAAVASLPSLRGVAGHSLPRTRRRRPQPPSLAAPSAPPHQRRLAGCSAARWTAAPCRRRGMMLADRSEAVVVSHLADSLNQIHSSKLPIP